MNMKEKDNFINGMIEKVKKEILNKLDKIPESWDGIELRFYIKDCFSAVVWGDLSDRRSKDHRNYVNDCYKNDL